MGIMSYSEIDEKVLDRYLKALAIIVSGIFAIGMLFSVGILFLVLIT